MEKLKLEWQKVAHLFRQQGGDVDGGGVGEERTGTLLLLEKRCPTLSSDGARITECLFFFFFHLPVLKFPELFHLILIQVEKGVRSFALVFIISLRLKFYVLVGYLIYLSNSNVNNPKYGRGFFRNPASLRHSLCLAFPPLSMGYKVHPRLCPLNSLVAQYFC